MGEGNRAGNIGQTEQMPQNGAPSRVFPRRRPDAAPIRLVNRRHHGYVGFLIQQSDQLPHYLEDLVSQPDPFPSAEHLAPGRLLPTTRTTDLDRRTVIRTAGIVGLGVAGATTLTACGGGTSSTAGGAPSSASGAGGAATEAIKVTDIPVGGGKVFAVAKVVVTQPKAGEFKAFSAICTHKGCTVAGVANGTITCPCHASTFDAGTGQVTGGPAPAPLPGKSVKVSGGTITVT